MLTDRPYAYNLHALLLTGEAGQVVHFVLEPAVLVLCEVGEAALGDLHQLLLHVQRSLVEQALRLQVGDAKSS